MVMDLTHIRLTFFIQSLSNFLASVRLPPEVFKELKGIISHFAFILTIFKKYEDTLTVCGMEGPHSEKVKAMGWLLYIFARASILKGTNEIVESACLLMVVLTALIVNKPRSVTFKKLKVNATNNTKEVKKALCDIFKLKSQEAVDSLMVPFTKLLQHLATSDVIKAPESFGEGKENEIENYSKIFSEEYIEGSLRKLNMVYQQMVPLDGIDERSFIASETRITTPVKLTPFARQGVANILLTPRKSKEMPEGDLAKRELGQNNKALANVTLNTKLHEFKLSQYPSTSPYPAVRIQATPITRAMEMNNWLHEHVSRVKLLENGSTSEYSRLMTKASQVAPRIKAIVDTFIEKISRTLGYPKEGKLVGKPLQVKCMYFRIAEAILLTEERNSKTGDISSILKSEDFHKGVLTAAAETTLFVHNSINLMFEEILDLAETSAFDFWKLLSSFLRFDSLMPSPVLLHFNEIENKILEVLAWEKKSPIYYVISQVVGEESKTQSTRPELPLKYAHERFFKKLLQFAAKHVEEITTALNLANEVIRERIWEATKLCLSSETDLLIDRHLDQIILCGIYAVCKMEQSNQIPMCDPYSFNNIITCYLQLNSKKGKNTSGLFQTVKLVENKAGDIIAFYNTIYVPRMKSALSKLCLEQEGVLKILANKAKIKVLAPLSPLKGMGERTRVKVHHKGLQLTPSKSPLIPIKSSMTMTPIMTPRTKQLIAPPESFGIRGGSTGIIATSGGAMNPGSARNFYRSQLVDKILKESSIRQGITHCVQVAQQEKKQKSRKHQLVQTMLLQILTFTRGNIRSLKEKQKKRSQKNRTNKITYTSYFYYQ
eukprot:TRINITY_DN275_c0_g1_i1.p1 TRINITY_DN275_c0_g1~~TRINITY_DN275_c0_g1_i1.p1  ORF type:complete len:831 (+),score=71.55 TRINITY_DN275_c0_g1_i1:7086-9578(+)